MRPRHTRKILHQALFRATMSAQQLLLALSFVAGCISPTPLLAFEPGPGAFEPGPSTFRPPPTPEGPEARDVVKGCREKLFVDCFRLWQPPEPPEPPPEPLDPPPPPPPGNNRPPDSMESPSGGGTDMPPLLPPTPPNPDQATYEALMKAIDELGLKNRLLLGPLPEAEGVTIPLTINPPPAVPVDKKNKRRQAPQPSKP